MPAGYTRVGKITRAVGLKGEVGLSIDSRLLAIAPADDPSEIDTPQLFAFVSAEPFPLKALSIKPDGQYFRARFEGINDRTAAERLRGLELYVQGDAPATKNATLSLIGLEAHDKQLGLIGVIEDVLDFPGQQLLKVTRSGKEVLIPFRDELILERTGEKVVFNLPEGLLDL